MRFVQPSILPGFGLSFGIGIAYMSLLVLLPLAVLVVYSTQIGITAFWHTISDKQVLNALVFSLTTSFCAALINLCCGFVVAWALARYDFFGKPLIDALVDLPFALPTAVAGIALAYLFSTNGFLGGVIDFFGESRKDFIGVCAALVFIGLPFVVRTLEPVIEDLDSQSVEAARSLGANFAQTFAFVILPSLLPAALTGFALAFARAIGEYGSVIFVSSNIPFESQILPVVIVGKIESHDYVGASVVGVFMICVSFVLLLGINALQKWGRQ